MYGQGNHTAQIGQSGNMSRPPLQQWPPPPPPPPPSISQAPRPPMMPHGPPSGPQISQLAPPAYQHAHPGVRHIYPPFPVPTSGNNSSQFYGMPPPPPPPAPVPVNTGQWNPIMHHIPPAVGSGAPRVLPPPPALGHPTYRGQVHQPSLDGMGGFLRNPPPPPPPPPQNSSFSTPSSFDPSMLSRNHDSPVPPALPSTQPPLPPSPPKDPPLPPPSPPLLSSTADANILSSMPVQTCFSPAKESIHATSTDKSSQIDRVAFNSADHHIATHDDAKDEVKHNEGIACREGFPVNKNLALDSPSSHPKSVSVAVPGEGSSFQLVKNSAPSHSASDSDMEMEDDITQLDEDQHIHSFGAGEQLRNSLTEDILNQNSSCCGPLEQEEQIPDSSDCAPSSFQEPLSGVNGLKMDNKPVLDDHAQASSFLDKDLSHPSPSPTNKGVHLENVHQLVEAASPFTLLQGYASDDSLDDANENSLENVGPLAVPSPRVVPKIDETDAGKSPMFSVKPSNYPGTDDQESCAAVKSEDSIGNIAADLSVKRDTAPEVPHQEAVLGVYDNDSVDLLREDARDTSPMPKVDEFGRLVRERVSETDSDHSPRHMRRRGKRGRSRSRSRSRSPYDRRRRKSPKKRKDRWGRSRSISPRRRRSRSKSPSRHGLTFGGDKIRRDRDHPEQCLDFLRGKCYRGASCRYSHAELDKSGRSRSHRSKFQHQDLPPNSKDSHMHDLKESHEKIDTTLNKSVHKLDKSEKQDIPDMKVNDMKACEENQIGLAATPAIVTEEDKVPGDPAGGIPSAVGTMGIHLSKDGFSDQMLLTADDKLNDKCDSSVSEPSSLPPSSMVPPIHLPQFSSARELYPSNVLQTAPLSASFPSLPQASSTVFAQQMPRDYTLPRPFNSAYIERAPPYQPPFSHQRPPFAVPLSSSWSSFPTHPALSQPPLPPFSSNFSVNAAGGQHDVPRVPFQPNMVIPRNDFMSQTTVRPYASTLPSVPQVGEHHSFVQTQPIYSRGSPTTRPPTFLGEPRPLGEHPGPASKSYPYVHQSACGPPQTAGTSQNVVEPEVSPSVSRYASDPSDQNQAHQLPDFGGSRISSHFNPYAATFDQPLTSKFGSSPLMHGSDMLPSNKYTSFSLNTIPVDGHPAESLGSRNITPPSARADEGMFSRPGGNQYDPLYDSIEPSANSLKKPDPGKKREVVENSGVMLRLSGSNEPLDVELNKRQKGGGAITFTASAENDEYGETAEAEVGAVENGSPSDSTDGEDIPTGEIEIEQVKPSGEKKKSKDSRSMKLFKIAVADFVKELLKPSWRQGNMSKEVFKTIVKKTVDKVSGAMKSHQIPKSKAKIDHYIDSSQRKLTKLVMGYVDKYVKV